MPLAAILSRASASMVPLATRALRNQIALSTLFPVQSSGLGLSLGQKLTRPSFVPIAKFSTDADENLLRVLEAEIDCADDPKGQPITDRIPFEIYDYAGERTILLARNYGDEVIQAVVDIVTDSFEDEDDDDGDEEDEDDDDGDDECEVPTVDPFEKQHFTQSLGCCR